MPPPARGAVTKPYPRCFEYRVSGATAVKPAATAEPAGPKSKRCEPASSSATDIIPMAPMLIDTPSLLPALTACGDFASAEAVAKRSDTCADGLSSPSCPLVARKNFLRLNLPD